jgi:hypothetical protein
MNGNQLPQRGQEVVAASQSSDGLGLGNGKVSHTRDKAPNCLGLRAISEPTQSADV